MSDQSTSGDPIAAFGPNEWLVDELYQQFLTDKNIGRQGLVGVLRGLPAGEADDERGPEPHGDRDGDAAPDHERCCRRRIGERLDRRVSCGHPRQHHEGTRGQGGPRAKAESHPAAKAARRAKATPAAKPAEAKTEPDG